MALTESGNIITCGNTREFERSCEIECLYRVKDVVASEDHTIVLFGDGSVKSTDQLLTDKEVAHILKVSRRTLQDYRNNGILSYIQVGAKILYRTSDVQRTIMSGFKGTYGLKDT